MLSTTISHAFGPIREQKTRVWGPISVKQVDERMC